MGMCPSRENELDLLRLGPGYMVVSKLDNEEMKVESSVTMTKIRWSRHKMGVDNWTEEQAKNEYVAPTVEEEALEDALESEARDVMSTDGSSICMERLRPTDMRNNREVRMPGPAPPIVEAQYSKKVECVAWCLLSIQEIPL